MVVVCLNLMPAVNKQEYLAYNKKSILKFDKCYLEDGLYVYDNNPLRVVNFIIIGLCCV
jgi:hypothetical protein